MKHDPWAGPDQVFFQVTRPDTHELSLRWWEEVGPGGEAWSAWTGQKAMKQGAWCLIYVTAPTKAFAWIARSLIDAEQPHGTGTAWSTYLELVPIRVPLGLSEAQGIPGLEGWGALGNLQGTSKQIKDPDKWDLLLARICNKNPELTQVLAGWAAEAPTRPEDDLADFFWDGPAPEGGYPFSSERGGLQLELHDLLLSIGMTPMQCGTLPSLEARLDELGRADIVLEVERPAPQTAVIVVIETKLFASTAQGIEQLLRYRRWFERELPDREVRYVLAAQDFSEEAAAAARLHSIDAWLLRYEDPDLDLITSGIDGAVTLDTHWSTANGAPDAVAARSLADAIVAAPARAVDEAEAAASALNGASCLAAIFRAPEEGAPESLLAAGMVMEPQQVIDFVRSTNLDAGFAALRLAWVPLGAETQSTVRLARALLDPETDLIDDGAND